LGDLCYSPRALFKTRGRGLHDSTLRRQRCVRRNAVPPCRPCALWWRATGWFRDGLRWVLPGGHLHACVSGGAIRLCQRRTRLPPCCLHTFFSYMLTFARLAFTIVPLALRLQRTGLVTGRSATRRAGWRLLRRVATLASPCLSRLQTAAPDLPYRVLQPLQPQQRPS